MILADLRDTNPEQSQPTTAAAPGFFGRNEESPLRRNMAASALAAINLGLKIGSNFPIIPLSLRYLGRQEYAVGIILQSLSVDLTLSEMGIG